MDFLMDIVEEVRQVLEKVDRTQIDSVVDSITKDRRIFIDGEGRSGFVGRCFAMRLMHLGYEVYVMGETITPAFEANDVFVCISGSGTTGSVLLNANKIKKKSGTTVITVTNSAASPLGDLADKLVVLEATVRGDKENRTSIQLLGSLFDQAVHLLLDNVCLIVSKRDGISNEKATEKHV